jgi:arsenate reductase
MTDQTITIYHNPGCSKSRQTLTILEQAGTTPEVIQYLTHPPTADQLGTLARQLGLAPSEFIRTGEPAYKTLDPPGPESSSVELLDAMAKHPILIQRPIVVRGNQAVLGRPPENVQQLL